MRRTTTQGEALVTWALWALLCVAIVVTYGRLEPAELYHVSRDVPLDPLRLGVGVLALLGSIPWLAAELGFYLAEGVFIMERRGVEADGTVLAAVHLGHHHGLDGTLLVASALLLTRVRLTPGRLATVTRLYLALAFAYGAVNLVQDAWNEQLVKRDWVGWKIPSALEPRPEPVWFVVLALAAAAALALRREGPGEEHVVRPESDPGSNVDSCA